MVVRAVMIVEIAGRPAEHVKASLQSHVEKVKLVKGVSDVEIQIHEPKEMDAENGQGMFTCFAEVEFSAEDFDLLTKVVFDFMPSSIELLEPSKVTMDLAQATAFLNNVAGRMHRYDEIAKVAQIRTQQMAQRMQIMQQELMKRDEELKKGSGKIKKKSTKKSKKKVGKKSSKKGKK